MEKLREMAEETGFLLENVGSTNQSVDGNFQNKALNILYFRYL
jgi:hypothetical protein